MIYAVSAPEVTDLLEAARTVLLEIIQERSALRAELRPARRTTR